MINTFSDTISTMLSINKAIDETLIECYIDEDKVSCEEMNTPPYVGVPAPKYLEDDEWFGPAIISDANKDYMQREYEAFKAEAHKFYGTQPESKESNDIHQVMYDMATQSSSTTIQLNPPGGSENFHGDWQSGAGKF